MGRDYGLIGRQTEIERLEKAYASSRSEFVALYGRRRVGKTFLIEQVFKERMVFKHTGSYKVTKALLLQRFYTALNKQGAKLSRPFSSWDEAFAALGDFLNASQAERKVVFIDEMPWMDTPRSGFVSALEYFWNTFAVPRQDILLIICGSASSWIISKVLKNRGGLHNRVTCRINLAPFTLAECELFSEKCLLRYSRQQIVDAYMVFGGIPFYWSKFEAGKSVMQNVSSLCFAENGELRYEYNEIYASQFESPEKYYRIIAELGRKKKGMTRAELIRATGLTSNGQISTMLENLCECGFIRRYSQLFNRKKDAVYQLMDNFTLFYFAFMADRANLDEESFRMLMHSSSYIAWQGRAFERVCMQHVRELKKALGIAGIISDVCAWQGKEKDGVPGAQIDLLIARSDNIVDLCEMKYTDQPYAITGRYWKTLENKRRRLAMEVPEKQSIHIVMVCPYGIKVNQFSDSVTRVVSLDSLFDAAR